MNLHLAEGIAKKMFLLEHFLSQPLIRGTKYINQQQRFRGKINIQKPDPPHHVRKCVEEFITPFYKNHNEKRWNECGAPTRTNFLKNVVNPYDIIIARECLNWFKNSNMVAFFHKNSLKQEAMFDMAVLLKHANMYIKAYGSKVIKYALENSAYEATIPLFKSSTFIIFSPSTNVYELNKITKKVPQVTLLAGILHGRLLNRNDFIKYGTMDITSAQAGLVQVLQNAGGVNLNNQLTHHQSTLVARLTQIGKTETSGDGDS